MLYYCGNTITRALKFIYYVYMLLKPLKHVLNMHLKCFI